MTDLMQDLGFPPPSAANADPLDRWREPDGQPKLSPGREVRIVLDVRLCEPEQPQDGQASRCPGQNGECGRIAFRRMGDNPWVDCVCGERFNVNYSNVGDTPWPVPESGILIVGYSA